MLKGKRVDWRHVGNLFWCLDDCIGWYALAWALLFVIVAFSAWTLLAFVSLVVLKVWAINWERIQWMK